MLTFNSKSAGQFLLIWTGNYRLFFCFVNFYHIELCFFWCITIDFCRNEKWWRKFDIFWRYLEIALVHFRLWTKLTQDRLRLQKHHKSISETTRFETKNKIIRNGQTLSDQQGLSWNEVKYELKTTFLSKTTQANLFLGFICMCKNLMNSSSLGRIWCSFEWVTQFF